MISYEINNKESYKYNWNENVYKRDIHQRDEG